MTLFWSASQGDGICLPLNTIKWQVLTHPIHQQRLGEASLVLDGRGEVVTPALLLLSLRHVPLFNDAMDCSLPGSS